MNRRGFIGTLVAAVAAVAALPAMVLPKKRERDCFDRMRYADPVKLSGDHGATHFGDQSAFSLEAEEEVLVAHQWGPGGEKVTILDPDDDRGLTIYEGPPRSGTQVAVMDAWQRQLDEDYQRAIEAIRKDAERDIDRILRDMSKQSLKVG